MKLRPLDQTYRIIKTRSRE